MLVVVGKLSYSPFPYYEILQNITKYIAGFWIVLPPPGNLVLTLKTGKTNFLKINYKLLWIHIVVNVCKYLTRIH